MTGTIRRLVGACSLFLGIALVCATVIAQDSRGSIAGLIVDTSGGALPGVSVTVVNNGTNSTMSLVTNDTGQYAALFLLPGTYRITAELSGFQTRDYPAVQVRVGERTQIDITMPPAGVTEQVQVVAEAPQLETSTASLGQVISSKLISEIPLGDGTAYGLTRLVAGATFERSYALQRPMDNDNLRGAAVTGTLNSEFTIDGSSNVVSQARVGIQPPADAIEEFKVETAAYDAQIGHTGAGGVNLALKTGTNTLHGALSFYNRDDSRSARLFASNRLGSATKQPRDYNRFSGTVSGPIFRNKTFFMFSYEKLQDDTVEALTTSVPTARMRTGDFSELLPLGVQIYDPSTARLVNGVVVRDPFPGNIIPTGRINPIARNVLGYFPAPNQAGAADLSQNFFKEQPWTYAYNFAMTRIDHEWTQAHRTYGRFLRNFRREERFNYAGEVNGVEITRGSTDRFNYNWAGGHTAVISPSMVLDLKGSWLRFNDDLFPLYTLDLGSLGYSQSTLGLLGDFEQLPRFSIESGNPTGAGRVATLGAQQSGFNNGRTQPFYNVQFAATLTKMTGGHTMKFGYDWRSLRQKETNRGWRGGAYGFDSSYTRASQTAAGQYGQGIAAFLLGLPTNNSIIELRPGYDVEVISHGFFAHDDWRVSDRLTLNLGIRYDLELGMTESENRNVGPFDLTTPNPIEAAAQARFAANPPAGVPMTASQFRVLGGYTYLSGNQTAWNADLNNFQPRLGFAYKLDDRTVLRGGGGKFVAPFQLQGVPGLISAINQIGYSRSTPVPVSADNGLTFQANLSNPVPSNQLIQPVGSEQGLRTNLGNAPGNIWNADRVNPEFWRFSIGVERQLPWEMLFEISYIGQKGNNQAILEALNYVPQQYRTRSLVRDTDAETFLTQAVANPFQGLTPDNPGANGATIPRRRLLYAYPQFDTSGAPCATGTSSTFCMETARGSNMYHGAIFRLDKRFSGGLMVMTSYTWSRLTEKVAPLNPWDELEERRGATDRPHRITLASVTELPFCRGRRFGQGWNPVLDGVLGGWQFSTKYEWQSGSPLVFNQNTYFDPSCGDPRDLKSNWGGSGTQLAAVDVPIIDISCFYTMNGQPFRNAAGQPVTFQAAEIQLGQANVRSFPTTLPNVRFMQHHLLDLGVTKNFQVGNNVRVQLRIEALNASNYTLFGVGNMVLTPNNASFMKLSNIDSSTVMKPRDIQIGARVTF